MEINKTEILRYLGYKGNKAQKEVMDIIDGCIKEIIETANMKSVYRIFDCEIENNQIQINGSFVIKSRHLSKNLSGCNEIVLFAATLGPKIDLLLKKYSRTDMTRAVVLQAASAAVIEEYCDKCQTEIENKLAETKRYIRPRFSPGYGDFQLEHQKELVSMLDCPRKIGLTLMDSLILAPSKSVTAVMGISIYNKKCHLKGCEACDKLDCEFRRG